MTVTMPVMRVLYLELAVETVVIVAFAVVLWLLAIAEKQEGADAAGPEWTAFSTKLALSLSSVRLNTDSIFGFKPRPVSSGAEIMVLVIEGWPVKILHSSAFLQRTFDTDFTAWRGCSLLRIDALPTGMAGSTGCCCRSPARSSCRGRCSRTSR